MLSDFGWLDQVNTLILFKTLFQEKVLPGTGIFKTMNSPTLYREFIVLKVHKKRFKNAVFWFFSWDSGARSPGRVI